MATLKTPASWLIDWFKGGDDSSVRVTERSMMGSAAIWYAINTIAGDVAKMPLDVKISRDGRGAEQHTAHPGWQLTRNEPNGWQTADVFKQQIQAHALSWGNGRAAIIRSGSRPVELIPLMPDRTATLMVAGEKWHVTAPGEDDPLAFRDMVDESLGDGVILPKDVIPIADRDVLHILGFGWDGFSGLSIADVARDSFTIDLQSQRFAKNGMARGFAGQLMLEAPPGTMTNEDKARQFLEDFRQRHENAKDGETVGLLREGITANVLNMSNKDAEFIDQRKFSRQDVMLWFGLQHIPGDDSSVSYNSLEQKQLSYLAGCLDRWLQRWESQCDSKLRTDTEKSNATVYFKFNRGSWLRTDTATTQTVLSGFVSSMILSRNEARDKLDMNPVEGGDEFVNPNTTAATGETEETPDDLTELFAARLQTLTQQEAARVIDAAGKPDKFCGWLDGFYSKWPITLLCALQPLGATPEQIQTRADEHKAQLLEAYAVAEYDGRYSHHVTDVAEGWT